MTSNVSLSTAELDQVAAKIRSLRQRATENAIEIGRALIRVKANLAHGVFTKWVEKECEFKIRTAQDLMKLAREVDLNAQHVALLMASTLRLLVSKNTPEVTRQLVRAKIEKGDCVSRSELTSAIRRARQDENAKDQSRHSISSGHPRAEGGAMDPDLDQSRVIAELLLKRLSAEDLSYIMRGIRPEVWSRVLLWLDVATTSETNGARYSSIPAAEQLRPGVN